MSAQLERNWQTSRTRFAVIMLAAGALIGLFIASRVTTGDLQTPLIGSEGNLALALVYSLPIVAAVTTALGYRRLLTADERLGFNERRIAALRGRQLIGRIVAALAAGGLIMTLLVLVFYLLTSVFTGVSVPRWLALIIALVASAATGFGVALWSVTLKTPQLLRLGLAFIVIFMLLAVINVNDPNWWQNAISFMSHDQGSSTFFRISLIVGGLVVMSAAGDIAAMFRLAAEAGQISQRSYRLLEIGLMGACIGLIGVGLFPTVVSAVSDLLHNIFISLMLVLLMAGMFFIPLVVPLPRDFRIVSIAAGIGSLVLFYLWAGAGLLIFVVFQVLILSLMGVWAVLLLRSTLAYVRTELPGPSTPASAS